MKIELQGPLAFIDCDPRVTINLRNLIELKPVEMGYSENRFWIVEAIVKRKPEQIEKSNDKSETARIWINVASKEEAEQIRDEIHAMHKKVCGCTFSSGIHDGLTVGHGKLSDSGFWEYGCNVCARIHEEKYPEEGQIWPWEKSND